MNKLLQSIIATLTVVIAVWQKICLHKGSQILKHQHNRLWNPINCLSPYLACFLPPSPPFILSFSPSPSGSPAASPLTNEETVLKRPDTTESLNSSMSNGTTDAGREEKRTTHSYTRTFRICASNIKFLFTIPILKSISVIWVCHLVKDKSCYRSDDNVFSAVVLRSIRQPWWPWWWWWGRVCGGAQECHHASALSSSFGHGPHEGNNLWAAFVTCVSGCLPLLCLPFSVHLPFTHRLCKRFLLNNPHSYSFSLLLYFTGGPAYLHLREEIFVRNVCRLLCTSWLVC